VRRDPRPAGSAPHRLLQLQRTAGNAAVVARLDDISPLKPIEATGRRSAAELTDDAVLVARSLRIGVQALYSLQHDYTDNAGLISEISETLGFAKRPSTASYAAISTKIRELEDETTFGRDPITMGRLASEARLLLDAARQEWRQFLEDTERGTDSAIFMLEAIRDICVAVEIALTAGLAAPAAAGGGAAASAGSGGFLQLLGTAGRQLFVKGGATLLVKGAERAITRGTEMAIGTRQSFDVESFGMEVGKAGLEAAVWAFADELVKPWGEKFLAAAVTKLGSKLPGLEPEVLKQALEIAIYERTLDVGKKLLKGAAAWSVEQLGEAEVKKVPGPEITDLLAAQGVDYLKAILEDVAKGAAADLTNPKSVAAAIGAAAKS
jgi:hypothetical protein